MIPYVMDDTKTLAELVADTSNGVGRLAECMSLEITESLAGEYYASMVIPIEAYNSGLVHRDGIIKTKANGSDSPQLFRIVRFKETLSSGLIECDLEHISYDLNKAIIACASPAGFSNTYVSSIVRLFNDLFPTVRTFPTGIFTCTTNIPNNRISMWRFTPPPKTVRETLLGDGGVCPTLGFQMHWDNLEFEIRDRRGTDKRDSVIISYGKNLVDFSQEADTTDVYDGIVGYVYVPNKWDHETYSDPVPLIGGTTPKHLLAVDLSSEAENLTVLPTKADVTAWATSWVASNGISTPKIAIDIDIVSLENNGEYDKLKELEGIELGDTITVKIGAASIDATITEVTYDSLTERYTEIKLGNYRPSLSGTILGLTRDNYAFINSTREQYSSVASSTSNGLMSSTDKATLDTLTPTMIASDDYVTNPASDYNTTRYSQWTFSGTGYAIVMINAYTSSTEDYGNIEISVRHSTDGGSTWGYDAYSAHRHDQTSADFYDGECITVPMAISNNERVRVTWKVTKEVAKAARIKILGFGVTATRTTNGGAL